MKPVRTKEKVFLPGVVVLEEKHGTAYFHAPDEATLNKVALRILTGRLKAGFWYPKPEEPRLSSAPDYTDLAEIEKLKGEIKNEALKRLKRWREKIAQYNDDVFQFDRIQKTVDAKDGATAWKILREHSGGEYEKINFEPYSTSYAGMT